MSKLKKQIDMTEWPAEKIIKLIIKRLKQDLRREYKSDLDFSHCKEVDGMLTDERFIEIINDIKNRAKKFGFKVFDLRIDDGQLRWLFTPKKYMEK